MSDMRKFQPRDKRGKYDTYKAFARTLKWLVDLWPKKKGFRRKS